MEKMTTKISLILFVGTIALIGIATGIKVAEQHKEKLLLSVRSKIEEAARKCFLEGKCMEESIKLNDLIELQYLEKLVHPITKEYISGELTIYCKDYVCTTTLQ